MNLTLALFLIGLAFICGLIIGRQSVSSHKTDQETYPHDPYILELRDRQEILNLLRQGKRIEAIKLYRSIAQSGLKEAKEAVEQLETEI
jgi:ribosomal protein L7/L12